MATTSRDVEVDAKGSALLGLLSLRVAQPHSTEASLESRDEGFLGYSVVGSTTDVQSRKLKLQFR